MALKYFNNAFESNMIPTPDTYYRDLEQAFVSSEWDNTTALYDVEEQDMIGLQFPKFKFHWTQAWVSGIVGETTTGLKNGEDFKKLLFKNLGHECLRGRYFKFDDNYWITTFTDKYESVFQNIVIRRCNNALRIVDPMNGKVFSIPCVIDYDMMAPNNQISRYVITPNNHAVVIVQGNKDTIRLFKPNKRFVISGRPFKLYSYQNALLNTIDAERPTILYLELYLDEIHAEDNLEEGLAYNGDFVYHVEIDSPETINVTTGMNFRLNASVVLNGVEVSDREIRWRVNNKNVLIDKFGNILVKGEAGKSSIATAYLKGNRDIRSSVTIQIEESQEEEYALKMSPLFDKIREYETKNFNLVVYDNEKVSEDSFEILVGLNPECTLMQDEFLSMMQNGAEIYLLCTKRDSVPHIIYGIAKNEEKGIELTFQQELKLVSLLG